MGGKNKCELPPHARNQHSIQSCDSELGTAAYWACPVFQLPSGSPVLASPSQVSCPSYQPATSVADSWNLLTFCLTCLAKPISPGDIPLGTQAAGERTKITGPRVSDIIHSQLSLHWTLSTTSGPAASLVRSLYHSQKQPFSILPIFPKPLTPPLPSYSQ